MSPARSLLQRLRVLHFLRSCIILACVHFWATAQELPVTDTLARGHPDTLKAEGIGKRFIPFIGNLDRSVDTTSLLQSRQFLHSDAIYVGDLLWKVPGVYLQELGEPGQPAELSVMGADERGISILLDGRPLNDPVTGGYDLYDLPLEYIDEVESFQGSSSLIQAANSVGGAFNFVTHQYNNIHPLTKLRFLQGPFEHILTDGIFSQDVSRSLNAMFGFQRHVTNGRFKNSAYDSWNFRLRLRYNVSDRLNAWVSEYYTKSTIGLNGGVDPDQSPSLYDEVNARVRDLTTYQIVSRHDPTVGIVGRFLADTASLTRALIYYSSIDREYSNGSGTSAPPTFSDFQASSFWGMKLGQNLSFPGGAVDVGTQFEKRKIGQSHFLDSRTENYVAVTARVTFQPVDWGRAQFSMRHEKLRSDNSLSRGLNLQTSLTDWLTIWGDYSRAYRLPTIQELYWTDSTIVRDVPLTKEDHTFFQLGLRFQSDPLTVSVTGFQRKIRNPIVFSQTGPLNEASSLTISSVPDAEMKGGTADLRLRIWNLELAGTATITDSKQQGIVSHLIPRFTSISELSYRDRFFKDELDLKAAFRVRAMSNHDGVQFVPTLLTYAQQDATEIPGFTSLDFYIAARLGDAYLTLVWENPLNVNVIVVPFYPLMSRNIKLGVNWIFSD